MSMNIRNTIKKTLKEAVGVVPHIHETAEKIYRILSSSLSNDKWTPSKWKNEGEKEFHFSGDFKMGEYSFSEVYILVKAEETDTNNPIEINKMAVALEVEKLQDFTLRQGLENDALRLLIVLDIDFESDEVLSASNYFGDYISDYIQSEKPTIVSSISHEIKHAYDAKRNEIVHPIDRATYKGPQNIGIGPVHPMQKFLFGLYFTHFIENSVRPNEMHSLMVTNNITPKQFYDFLTNQRLFKIFKEYRDLTFEKFFNELKTDYISEIEGFFIHVGFIGYKRMDDDEKVQKFLDFIARGLKNSTIQELEQLVFDSEGEAAMAQLGLVSKNKLEYMIKNAGIINKRFPDDGEKMFRSEIKDLNRISEKMIKKISKLYSLINNKGTELTKVEKYKRHKK